MLNIITCRKSDILYLNLAVLAEYWQNSKSDAGEQNNRNKPES